MRARYAPGQRRPVTLTGMSDDTTAVLADGIRKRYGRTTALDGFDLAVPAGTVYGVLGPNGAGKTTAVRILTTLLRLDAGRARVAGYDVRHRARAGSAPRSA